MKTLVLTSMIAAFFVACGESADSIGSCMRADGAVCTDLADEAQAPLNGDACGLLGEHFSREACPSDHLVGSCDDERGEIQRFYDVGPSAFDRDSARSVCASANGNFSD